MAIHFTNLDSITRDYMRGEIGLDLEAGKVYYSAYLKDGKQEIWDHLLLDAATEHDDKWLEEQIQVNDLLVSNYQRRKPSGGYTLAKVPVTAPQTLAEGEFNRFYCRAVCLRAIEEGRKVEVYRGKEVAHARSASIAMIGREFDPEELLNDLRTNIGVDTALGLPAGPNSGLTIKLA